MNSNCDVLITGAGPVGLTMASELSRYGLNVCIIDQNKQRTDKSKALVVWPRTLELMDRMGRGCVPRFIETGLRVQAARVLSESQEIARVDMSEIESPYKFALMIPQSDTERLLEEHLVSLGVYVDRQLKLKQFQLGANSVSCTLVHSDNTEETVEASWLIGCDGAHSTVRHQLSFEFHGSTLLSDWILADIHLSGIQANPAIDIFWHAEGMLALFPLQGTRYRVIADIGESSGPIGEGNRLVPTLEEVQQIIDRRGPGGIQASDPVWLSSFSINERKVSDYLVFRRYGRLKIPTFTLSGSIGIFTAQTLHCRRNLAGSSRRLYRRLGKIRSLERYRRLPKAPVERWLRLLRNGLIFRAQGGSGSILNVELYLLCLLSAA